MVPTLDSLLSMVLTICITSSFACFSSDSKSSHTKINTTINHKLIVWAQRGSLSEQTRGGHVSMLFG
jgi:hypothetical protein